MKVGFFSIVKTISVITLLILLVIGGHYLYKSLPDIINYFLNTKQEAAAPGHEVVVTIPKGASLSEVGGILQENGIISSKLVFKIVAFIRGEQRHVKAGDYLLKTGSDPGNVLDLLISGKTLVYTVTVPEGYNIFQIADLFEQKGIASRKDFLTIVRDPEFLRELGIDGTSVEGFLFPDTYFIRPSEKTNARLVVKKMVARFHSVYNKYVRTTAEKFGWDPLQVVTLASLIEKEAKPNEHALVSAVFHNRLRQNMKLQCDPTVIYGIKPMGAKITRADLDRKQPYNTYQHTGLPPGPIANPGKESLIAAVFPADVDYLYFVAKNDGTHQFSKSLAEHNKWVNVYQRQPSSLTP
ncbi:MAG: endolytic transglycosylase MltG [Deltaproteobacteria bacterium]|nr:endolytic transglycosylase MltG [Deltaproteobacteria bacterium]